MNEDATMFAEPRTVYFFRCSANWKRQAATLDKRGTNLPATSCLGGNWLFLNSRRLSDGTTSGVADDALRAALAADGWYQWDAPATVVLTQGGRGKGRPGSGRSGRAR